MDARITEIDVPHLPGVAWIVQMWIIDSVFEAVLHCLANDSIDLFVGRNSTSSSVCLLIIFFEPVNKGALILYPIRSLTRRSIAPNSAATAPPATAALGVALGAADREGRAEIPILSCVLAACERLLHVATDFLTFVKPIR
jgi:hypothetical protein